MNFLAHGLGKGEGHRTTRGWQQPSEFLPDDVPDTFADARGGRRDVSATQEWCSDAWMSLLVGRARLEGALIVDCLSDEGVDGYIDSHPAHEDPQLLVVSGLWVGTAAQTERHLQRSSRRLWMGPYLHSKKVLGPLPSVLSGEHPQQLAPADIPQILRWLIILEPALSGAF